MTDPAAGGAVHGHKGRLLGESAGLIVLLAMTWLVVGATLNETDTVMVSAGRTGFTALGLLALTGWARVASQPQQDSPPAPLPYRWWQLALLALTGVSAYTVFSTVAINLAGPALPTLIMALTPAAVLLAESVLSRTLPALPTMLGTTLAVLGAVVYIAPRLAGATGSGVGLGVVFAFAAMLSMAFYGLYFAKVNQHHRGPMAARILPILALGAAPLVVWALAQLAGGDTVSWKGIGLLAVLGIVIYVPVYLLQHRIILSAGPSYA
ncbi:MAG: DMT family transporter, partial [Specibacter sp.]